MKKIISFFALIVLTISAFSQSCFTNLIEHNKHPLDYSFNDLSTYIINNGYEVYDVGDSSIMYKRKPLKSKGTTVTDIISKPSIILISYNEENIKTIIEEFDNYDELSDIVGITTNKHRDYLFEYFKGYYKDYLNTPTMSAFKSHNCYLRTNIEENCNKIVWMDVNHAK